MARISKQWVLKNRPSGDIKDSDLELVSVTLPELAEGEVLVRNIYLSLDPTNRIWMSDIDQYMPPVEIGAVMRGGTIGVVEESKHQSYKPGDIVTPFLSGWQEYIVTPGTMVRRQPTIPGVPITALMSVAGPTGWTAYFGMLEIGKPKAGETVVVSAAAGAVGSVAGQLAKMQGARVVGIAGGKEKCRWITEELGFDGAIDYKSEDVGKALDKLCPAGIDVNFENVGGEIMNAVMARMNNFSRMPVCGLISTYNSKPYGPPNFQQILMHRINVRGFIVSDFLQHFGEATEKLIEWTMAGKLKYKVHVEPGGIEKAVSTVRLLFSGAHDGKLLQQLSTPPSKS
jgi:NADPH-dependent curcumin reductase CurA